MKAKIEQNDNELTIVIEGRLDTMTSRDLEKQIGPLPQEVDTIFVDVQDLEYIASSGIRILVNLLKQVNKKGGTVTIQHPNEFITDVLDSTGLMDIFEVEE